MFLEEDEFDSTLYILFLKFFDHKAKLVIADTISDLIEIKELKNKYGTKNGRINLCRRS